MENASREVTSGPLQTQNASGPLQLADALDAFGDALRAAVRQLPSTYDRSAPSNQALEYMNILLAAEKLEARARKLAAQTRKRAA